MTVCVEPVYYCNVNITIEVIRSSLKEGGDLIWGLGGDAMVVEDIVSIIYISSHK